MKLLRIISQLFFLQFILYISTMTLVSSTTLDCESYCPNGMVATLIPSIQNSSLICAMKEMNLAIFIGVILLTMLAGRAFCSWVCPLGTISEWLAGLGKKLKISRKLPENRRGNLLFTIKYIVLILIIIFSAINADLVFRKYCPYFTLFSFHGHEVQVISYFILANVLLAGLIFPMFWCRVLCPLNAFFRLFSKFPGLKVSRNKDKCNDCGLCDMACMENIKVSKAEKINAGSCTNCLECINSCPNDALSIDLAGKKGMPSWIIPLIVAGLIVGAACSSSYLRIPSYEAIYEKPSTINTIKTASFIIDGLRCRSSAATIAKMVSKDGGLVSLAVYTSRREMVVAYYEDKVIPEELIYRFDRDIEINGVKMHPFKCRSYKTGKEWVVLHEEKPGIIEMKELKEMDIQ